MNQEPELTPLTEYVKNGYRFSLFKRSGDVAIFRGAKDSSPSDNWEVICIQKTRGGVRIFKDNNREPIEVTFTPKEMPPSDTQWGEKGFTCLNLDAAVIKMNEILATTKQPNQ